MTWENRTLKSILIILFFIPLYVNAQFRLGFNFESGLYSDLTNTFNDKISLINRLVGSAKYKYSNENTESSLKLKLGSDYFSKNLNSIKFNSTGTYTYRHESVLWKSIINYDYGTHNFNNINSNVNIFSIIGGIEYYILNDIPLSFLLGYSNQNIFYENKISSDFIFADLSIINSLSNYFSVSYGLFAQNYITKSVFSYSGNNFDSKGIKYGPQITINFLKSFLFNLEYRFLLYSSNQTRYPSHEHQIKILSGVIINDKVSIFLLADLLIRKINFKNSISIYNPNLFMPIKNENQIALKVSYLISSSTRPYIKIGFFNEDLFIDNRQLKGLNFLGGIELKF